MSDFFLILVKTKMANVCEFDASLSKVLLTLKESGFDFVLKQEQVESFTLVKI